LVNGERKSNHVKYNLYQKVLEDEFRKGFA